MTAKDLTRDEWLAMRHGIGSSDSAAACGEAATSPAELVLQLRGVLPHPELTNTEALEWGRLLQPAIVAKTAERAGVRLLDPVRDREMIERELQAGGATEVLGWLEGREPLLRSVAHPWMGATLDAVGIDDMGLVLLEVKNAGQYFSSAWDPALGQAPAKFDVQVAHILAVAPVFSAGYLSGLIGGNSLRVLRRERVALEVTIEAVILLEAEVWRCVETGDMPAYDGSESHIRALRALHPMDSGETITLPEEALRWHEDLTELVIQRAPMESRIKTLRRNIEASLNGATFGGLPDGSGVYTNKHQTRGAYHVEEAEFPVLRFVKAANWDAEKQYRGHDL